mmetsp:Transcript_31651/g.82737  ORF Transcript_31651/g.82737 Transcript_31651/m.82737 type:complete len:216 (+) Transcript_31651:511-1158(+)
MQQDEEQLLRHRWRGRLLSYLLALAGLERGGEGCHAFREAIEAHGATHRLWLGLVDAGGRENLLGRFFRKRILALPLFAALALVRPRECALQLGLALILELVHVGAREVTTPHRLQLLDCGELRRHVVDLVMLVVLCWTMHAAQMRDGSHTFLVNSACDPRACGRLHRDGRASRLLVVGNGGVAPPIGGDAQCRQVRSHAMPGYAGHECFDNIRT